MDSKLRGKIINATRRLTFAYSPRTIAKNRQKRGPATYECQHCQLWVYEGKRELESILDSLMDTPPNGIIKGKISVDHIEPVIPVEGFKNTVWDWNEYYDRMFCPVEGFQVLCKDCHHTKTQEENKGRRAVRAKNKKKSK